MLELLIPSLLETLYMVFFSTIFSLIIGFPLGVLLVITEKGGIWEKPLLNQILSGIINILRSFPFIILMILVFPLSRIIVGSTIGTTATIVPLSIAAAPFVARVIENALKEVDRGVIEASLSMGATVSQIVFKVLIPEAMPSLVMGITLTIINLIGYSAMAGAIGGGGLGDLAIRYGLYRFKTNIMVASVIIIIILVQGIQFLGNKIAISIDKK
ncbi:ABC transporter permease [Anaerosalibacter bizertensis]|uniref:ABC transporter permease n=1 Tax=Anaerosalibacter bizertensis TaxID=932217 RepID=A0A9Q4ABA8_9FIRM|nr:methionine ABC transporter permease [Anaerosalibacter bizertensis]MBV1818130.1 ABC transporter permease [Bacteroidales bacterium MSK.15.36]MCB5560648.1 ABC transporter permease [Anaerosalibacter bizertensis]MCG4564461.1 ABC transporter permease [Anaerosalibacter bizertensis]MCG4581351.1 ABC transporter permease [Anaerosalibacter bizertensis]MCG4585597.1 ABC transporter permease [Anaerosalibacter bizertensis]